MIRINVDSKLSGKKIITIIQNKYPKCALGTIHRALRNKDIKVNGTREKDNVEVYDGDELEIYITDELLNGLNSKTSTHKIVKKNIAYEDDNILIYNKPQELEVQGKKDEPGLEELLYDYLKEKTPNEKVFLKACHRLDRNTKGLVIFAKNKNAEETMLSMIKDRIVKKYYKAQVYGIPKNKAMTLKAYLFKDSKRSMVVVSDSPKRGYQEIITKYRVIEADKQNKTAIIEVELITGRTHQIRAHMAHYGYPIIGDGKYGINQVNKAFKKKYQELEAYKIVFEDAYDELEYLKNKKIEI
ncbi:MAG: RluA family pseudouridine synthase [Clostridia bacterium]|nr:RluA family pseudouridine synthase [Clostridia bacterium]